MAIRLTMLHAFLFRCIVCFCVGLGLVGPGLSALTAMPTELNEAREKSSDGKPSETAIPPYREVMTNYCVDCHSGVEPEGDLDLDSILDQDIERHTVVWEQVVGKLRSRRMPPAGELRPSEDVTDATMQHLIKALDAVAAKHPQPGRTDTFRRLNRIAEMRADLGEPPLPAAMRRGQHALGTAQMTGDDFGPGLLQQKASPLEQPLQRTRARHAALGKKNQLAAVV